MSSESTAAPATVRTGVGLALGGRPWAVSLGQALLINVALLLALLFWQWRPMTGEVWNVAGSGIAPVLVGLSFAGWGLVLVATILEVN